MGSFFGTLKGKKVAFIGAGVSHRQLVGLFAAAGAAVRLCDKRTAEALGRDYIKALEKQGVELCLGEGYLAGLAGQQVILRTPGFDYFTPELQAAGAAGALLTSEIELFFEHCPCRTVGVTGSDGKTTTTSLIAAMYAAAGRTVHLGGNIGRALLPIVDEINPADVAVVELSSFQLISMRRSPNIAVLTNLTPNHLDHHRDMDEYVNAKRNILNFQGPDDVAVLNYENALTHRMALDVAGQCRWFTRLRQVEEGAFMAEDGALCLAERGLPLPVLHSSEVKLPGLHNIENMLAAFAALRDEVPIKAMQQAARTFAGVEHRLEEVRTVKGVRWVNDSIATTTVSAIAGLRAFGQRLIWLAGGSDKKLDYTPLGLAALEGAKLAILMGPTAGAIEAAIQAAPGWGRGGLTVLRAGNMEEAVALAAEHAAAGDIVLLSPASASFDAYANFEERGRHFKALVNAL